MDRKTIGGIAAIILVAAVASISAEVLDLEPSTGSEIGPPPVVMVSIDTMRWDRVSAAGYDRNITPHLDRFIEDSTYYRSAYANAQWTLPSHSTVFTGKYPSETGALTWDYRLCNETTTFAERFQDKGYKTVSFNGDAAIADEWGFDQGFETYSQKNLELHDGNSRSSLEWLDNRSDNRFLLFTHGYDVHTPYVFPTGEKKIYGKNYSGDMIQTETELRKKLRNTNYSNIFDLYWNSLNTSDPEDVDQMVDMYDNSIYYMDRSLGRLFDKLREENLYDRSLIIVFSDHGEEFGEHGMFRHQQMHSETIKALLAVKYPGQQKGREIETRAELIDIYPTLMETIDTEYQGRGIPLQKLGNGKEHDSIYAEVEASRMLIKDDMKLIRERSDGGFEYELYNLEEDPREKENLAPENSAILQDLNRSITSYPERNYSSYCRVLPGHESLFEQDKFLK